MKISKEAKHNMITVAWIAVGAVIAINVNSYVVTPAVAWAKGKMSKPLTPTTETPKA